MEWKKRKDKARVDKRWRKEQGGKRASGERRKVDRQCGRRGENKDKGGREEKSRKKSIKWKKSGRWKGEMEEERR